MLCTLIVALTRLPPGLRLLRHLSKMTKFRNCTNIVGACREVSCFAQFYRIITHYFHQTLAFVFTIIVYQLSLFIEYSYLFSVTGLSCDNLFVQNDEIQPLVRNSKNFILVRMNEAIHFLFFPPNRYDCQRLSNRKRMLHVYNGLAFDIFKHVWSKSLQICAI